MSRSTRSSTANLLLRLLCTLQAAEREEPMTPSILPEQHTCLPASQLHSWHYPIHSGHTKLPGSDQKGIHVLLLKLPGSTAFGWDTIPGSEWWLGLCSMATLFLQKEAAGNLTRTWIGLGLCFSVNLAVLHKYINKSSLPIFLFPLLWAVQTFSTMPSLYTWLAFLHWMCALCFDRSQSYFWCIIFIFY